MSFLAKLLVEVMVSDGYSKQDLLDELPRIASETEWNGSSLLDWRASFTSDCATYLQQRIEDYADSIEDSLGDEMPVLLLKHCAAHADWEEIAKELLEWRYWGSDATSQLLDLARLSGAYIPDLAQYDDYRDSCSEYCEIHGSCDVFGFQDWLDHGKLASPYDVVAGSVRMLEWGVKS